MTVKLSGKMRCTQIHVDAARWPDEMLQHFEEAEGTPITPGQARQGLQQMKEMGYEVLPCKQHQCDEKGHCSGDPL